MCCSLAFDVLRTSPFKVCQKFLIFQISAPSPTLNFGGNPKCHLSQNLQQIDQFWANFEPPGTKD